MFDPDSVSAAGSLAGNEIDTKGWRWLHVAVSTGTVAATAGGSITVQSATTSGGSFSDITGAAFTVAATDDNTVLHGVIDLMEMNRYIKLAGTSGTGGATEIAVTGVLYGCADTTAYISSGAGEADELAFTVLM